MVNWKQHFNPVNSLGSYCVILVYVLMSLLYVYGIKPLK